jgi:hypothetical protein
MSHRAKVVVLASAITFGLLPAAAPFGAGAPPRKRNVKPSDANTGVARCPALTSTRGRTITRDDTRLENLDVRGQVTIRASNVIVRCVRVRSKEVRGVFIDEGRKNLLDRVEVDCQSGANNDAGVAGANYTLRRVNIHQCEDGAKVGQNVVVEDSYIHDLNTVTPGPHYDGLQVMGCQCYANGTLRNVMIRRNNIVPRPPTPTGKSSGATSSIIIQSAFGRIDGVSVQSNRLNCGAYTVYSRNAGHGAPINVRFRNNRIGRCYEFGVHSFDGNVSWTRNVWEDTGRRVP